MSTKTAAGPSAPARLPSSTRALKVSRSPSRCGSFSRDAVLAHDRHGGVRSILGKTADGPFRQQMPGQQMAGGSGRPVGESDGVRADAGQRQSLAFQSGAARVHDDQRRHHVDLDRRLAWWGSACRAWLGVCADADNGIEIKGAIVINARKARCRAIESSPCRGSSAPSSGGAVKIESWRRGSGPSYGR